ncbi:V-type ATP synthase subunit A [Flagellimonas meridianipacifica]|uniref:V/A-type H+-transporting ATPase subunit A n=1 Tax=Flagellimonas meridianipacifica TaxID=1080225 RepID=A0A2T0MD47_9FLAO|nr:V-type ATP synthase subunit A [Allomuricauda pacifica]PRX55417.1 V/A-type H+-transporting ATPase subunit A [Allomuricauda pacifica]
MQQATGKVHSVNESLVGVHINEGAIMNGEVAYIILEDGKRLKAEVIDVKKGKKVYLQVFEDTSWMKVGDPVEFSGLPLSVKLGPGILGSVTDGLQNPLYELGKIEWFLERGLEVEPLDNTKKWHFTPFVKKGDIVTGGSVLGSVPEKLFEHKIFVPFSIQGNYIVEQIASEGEYTIDETIAIVNDIVGKTIRLTMAFEWPVKKPMPFYERSVPTDPMPTGIRILDALFPIAQGGTACSPGPFGAGKTVLQHSLAKHSQADVVIIAACGERAGEAVEVFKDFPELIDPRTGKSLMDRTYIVGNTSSMPVAAREASVYLATTVGEYYRKQGLNVLILADSTSRWAQALRETSGRKEEIPGPEAFPMYISTLISAFYDRAGVEVLSDGKTGSLSIIGTVSPAGGNFDEPVTQATLLSTGAFWGLSRALSDARKYPAIDRIDSNSKYPSLLEKDEVSYLLELLREGKAIASNIILMGEKGITDESYIRYQKAELVDAVFLQQNSFHEVDGVTNPERLRFMFNMVKKILDSPVHLKGKGEIRSHFNFIRQAFQDWNYTPEGEDGFDKQKTRLLNLVKQMGHVAENV